MAPPSVGPASGGFVRRHALSSSGTPTSTITMAQESQQQTVREDRHRHHHHHEAEHLAIHSRGRRWPPLLVGLEHDQVEPWQRFPHLERGYRKGGNHLDCVLSLLQLHNETLNAWTMIAGVVLGVWVFRAVLGGVRLASWLEAAPFVTLLLAQLLHTPCSAAYHTFMCMSATEANRWRRLDLSMIFILNVLTTFALSFYTWGLTASLVLALADAAVAAVGIRNTSRLAPGQPLDRKRIVALVFGTAFTYYAPVVWRGVRVAVAARSLLRPELWAAVMMLSTHIGGAVCYVKHWPQRNFPRVFDLCGFSHNIMHVAVVGCYLAAYPYVAMLHAEQQRWATLAY